jgi:hypothetical protein
MPLPRNFNNFGIPVTNVYTNQNQGRTTYLPSGTLVSQPANPYIGTNYGNAIIVIDNSDEKQSPALTPSFPTKDELKHDVLLTDAHHPEDACIICLERKRTCIIRPCKHASLCVKCSTPEIKQCPVCRVRISGIEHAFI